MTEETKPRHGRPRVNDSDRRSNSISFLATTCEYEAIKNAAESANMKLGEFIRFVVMSEVKKNIIYRVKAERMRNCLTAIRDIVNDAFWN